MATKTTAAKKTGNKHVSASAPKKAPSAPAEAPKKQAAPATETKTPPKKGSAKSVPALAIKVVEGATNTARPTSKRHAWIAAIMGAKTVQAALETKMPEGVEPVNMGHITWCIKAKLVRTEPLKA